MEQTYEQEFLDELKQLGFFDKLKEHGLTPQEAAHLLSKTMINTSHDITSKVTNILSNWGFTSNLKGFQYLRRAIIYCVENGTNIPISTAVYSIIAKEFNTTNACIERTIRYSLEKAIDLNYSNFLETIEATVYSSSGRLQVSNFIALVADRIRNNLL